ncbi:MULTISPECIES: hypothetical protein [Lactococcus]|jgi:cell division protein FtsB|uniref:Uncharacterized protein n=1 Tax=Lactococcus formosensis TaxID=1281486 RepID=A0A9Q8Y2Z6_9LACT|nr:MULTISPECIES: hypothetical protein [Lactococcus]USI66491.1 hypothetical protein LMK05_04230 [Lactococcus petauri]USJ21122.1 hypothetical protein LMK00_03730 [Lactococcus formosensis]WJE13601.1 hypothetical protein QR692_04125 [Lactococcus petauri]
MKKWIKQHPKKFKARGWKIVFSILVAYLAFICYGAFSPAVSMQDGGNERQEIAAKEIYENNKLISQQKLVDEASKLTPSRTKEIQQLESSLLNLIKLNFSLLLLTLLLLLILILIEPEIS